ncbi:hypothetical protein PY650_14965 [Rhizobium calliandrae]|uniref:Uncharacterized protein n=1 Tax=Rhizobium calliandrae TaxID=1312182 RepID=A0ABT7KIC4_9HYPH|nr:hypothetical protein [Rhizobium calliandrae]MDL2406939.1 hypothetical protein [Rhizobium calliandrae]
MLEHRPGFASRDALLLNDDVAGVDVATVAAVKFQHQHAFPHNRVVQRRRSVHLRAVVFESVREARKSVRLFLPDLGRRRRRLRPLRWRREVDYLREGTVGSTKCGLLGFFVPGQRLSFGDPLCRPDISLL